MKNDPLTEFVNQNYSRRPSSAQLSTAKWFARFLVIFCSAMSLWVIADLINEVRPAWRLETADAIVTSKHIKYGRGSLMNGRIYWAFVDEYDPKKNHPQAMIKSA